MEREFPVLIGSLYTSLHVALVLIFALLANSQVVAAEAEEEQHAGGIDIDSEQDKGTNLTLWLSIDNEKRPEF